MEAALSSLDPAERQEEAVFLAVEMLRLGILKNTSWFPNISGGPMRGSGEIFLDISYFKHPGCAANPR
jgi:hypothetical protein